ALPALRIARHPRGVPLRLDVLQGAVRVPRLPRALRPLQGDLMSLFRLPAPADATAEGSRPVADRHRARFHTLTVSDVRRLTDDAVEVTFRVPAELADDYAYLPGQYVALRAHLNGAEVRRSYSLCRPPAPVRDGATSLSVAVKRDEGGIFSTWAQTELTPGFRIDVMSPQGTFTSELEELEGTHVVGIAAGSGITPMMALARNLLTASDTTRFTLLFNDTATT